jgi:hypothetical protein
LNLRTVFNHLFSAGGSPTRTDLEDGFSRSREGQAGFAGFLQDQQESARRRLPASLLLPARRRHDHENALFLAEA